MKNLWTKVISGLAALSLTAGLAFGFTSVLDGIGLGSTTAPALTSCGTTPSIVGTDLAGTVTMGTTATGCVITFNTAKSAAPHCVVQWIATPLASQSYTTSTTAITTTQTSTSNNVLKYICVGI
jgi:hypothetical protein